MARNPSTKTAPSPLTTALQHDLSSRLAEVEQTVTQFVADLERLRAQVRDVSTRLGSCEVSVKRSADVETRTSALEQFTVSMSAPEQLKALQSLFKEQVAQFEWLARMYERIRETVAEMRPGVADDESKALAAAMPDPAALVAALGGRSSGGGLDLSALAGIDTAALKKLLNV